MIVESRAKMQQTVINNLVPSGLFAFADQVQLEQVLVNLLVNSCDAVARNQHRSIDIILLSQDSESIKLAVSDSGSGFGEDIIKKIIYSIYHNQRCGIRFGLKYLSLDYDPPKWRYLPCIKSQPRCNGRFGVKTLC